MIPKLVYYSPGDRAQKLSPEARKQTRASESLKTKSKKTILRFPTFLFTISLVIERKKLSPEARKQTRASESLKIRSNNQFCVSAPAPARALRARRARARPPIYLAFGHPPAVGNIENKHKITTNDSYWYWLAGPSPPPQTVLAKRTVLPLRTLPPWQD